MYHYAMKKKKKLVTLEKAGDECILTVIRFSSETGEKTKPIKFRLKKEILEKNKAMHEEEIADIDTILTDMKLLT